jgi:hypothetical protein
MTEQDKEQRARDDRNDEIDESPVPDPTDRTSRRRSGAD